MSETMSLNEMKIYKGSRDKPNDFDYFWEKQIRQLNLKNDYTLYKCHFMIDYADCYDLTIQMENNSSTYCKVLKPLGKGPFPVVFHFHGYQGQSSDWSEYFKYILAGYAVVAMDVRGQAGKSVDGNYFKGNTVKGHIVRGMTENPNDLFFKNIYLDVYRVIELVSTFDWVDKYNLTTLGASQGGALALVGGALNNKIKKVITIYPFLSDFSRVLELKLSCEPYDELFRYFKFKDPFYMTEQSILSSLDYIDVKNFSSLINGDVKLVTGLRDDICLPSTQYAIVNHLKTSYEHIILPEYGHEAMNVFMHDKIMNWITGDKIGEQ